MRVVVLVALTLVASRAFAQNDISGEWANLLHEDVNHRNDAIGGGPRVGDYTGLPINDAARARADAWDAAINTLPEHQTVFAPAAYWARGGGGMRISKVVNDDTQQLIAYKIYRAGAPSVFLNPNAVGSTGGSQPHNNFQPYLCVDFIISLFGIFPSQT